MVERNKNRNKRLLFLCVIFLAMLIGVRLFLTIAVEIKEGEIFYLDELLGEDLSLGEGNPIHTLMEVITKLGSVPFLTFATISLAIYLFLARKHSNQTAIFLLINMIGISLMTTILKDFFHRDRPGIFEQYDGTGYSFPSGHTTGSISFYGFCAYLVWLHVRETWKRVILTAFLLLLALMISFSRVILAVHYVTDIVAGAAIASIWLLLCILLLEVLKWSKHRINASL